MGFIRFGLIVLSVSWLANVTAMEPSVIVARIDLPGASPERIEREVAIPLERVLDKLQGVKAKAMRVPPVTANPFIERTPHGSFACLRSPLMWLGLTTSIGRNRVATSGHRVLSNAIREMA